ncbi:MAG TPA: type II secretion system protein GspJ [Polyangiaceae bacterium]
MKPSARAVTLVELMIAISVLAMISVLIYSAFSGMRASRDGIQRIGDRYREGRIALARIAREVSSAYLSGHEPIDPSLKVQQTAFVATQGTPADRLDFNSFAYRRLDRDVHESDQAEISYFGSQNPDENGVIDLARRVSPLLDLEPKTGGRVDVLATDIDLFDLEFLDPMTGLWEERWDTTSAIAQENRLPLQVRIILVLNGGRRTSERGGQETIRLVTKVPIQMPRPLTFATQGEPG